MYIHDNVPFIYYDFDSEFQSYPLDLFVVIVIICLTLRCQDLRIAVKTLRGYNAGAEIVLIFGLTIYFAKWRRGYVY